MLKLFLIKLLKNGGTVAVFFLKRGSNLINYLH
jgi:hypothetical protein